MNWYKKAEKQLEFDFDNKEKEIPHIIPITKVPPISPIITIKEEKSKPELKPYYAIKKMREKNIRLPYKNIWAYSPKQAKFRFLQKYPSLHDYILMGYDIVPRVDEIAYNSYLEHKKYQQEQKDKSSDPNQWWNK